MVSKRHVSSRKRLLLWGIIAAAAASSSAQDTSATQELSRDSSVPVRHSRLCKTTVSPISLYSPPSPSYPRAPILIKRYASYAMCSMHSTRPAPGLSTGLACNPNPVLCLVDTDSDTGFSFRNRFRKRRCICFASDYKWLIFFSSCTCLQTGSRDLDYLYSITIFSCIRDTPPIFMAYRELHSFLISP
jgi:hypothetical protein